MHFYFLLLTYSADKKPYLTKEQALMKARQYCAYQERSHYEVVQKLWDLGVRKAEHDEIIAALIEDDYLNEERFAIQYAGGKFRMKEWGRKKIYYALKEKTGQRLLHQQGPEVDPAGRLPENPVHACREKIRSAQSGAIPRAPKKDHGLPDAKRF